MVEDMQSASHKSQLKTNLIYRLNYSANLVERLLKFRLKDGRTISDLFTIEGISFLDIFTAELAHVHLPQVFLTKKDENALYQKFVPKLLRIRSYLNQILFEIKPNNKKKDKSIEKDCFVLLGFTNRMYIDILQPIISNIKKRNNRRAVTLMDDDLPARHERMQDDDVRYIWQYNDKKTTAYSNLLKKSLNNVTRQINLDSVLLELLPENDLIYLTNIKYLLNRLFFAYMPNSIKYITSANYFIRNYKPSIIISPDTADSRTRIFTIVAKKFSIPCLEVQFGLAGDEAVEWRFSMADKIAVWGESSKNAMLKQFVQHDRIVLTGSPRHDVLLNSQGQNSDFVIPRIPIDYKVVLLASTYNFKDKNHADISVLKSMQLAIAESISRTSNIFLLIKPHPHEDVVETKSFFQISTKIHFIEKDADIKKLIPLCDAFISYGSTATIDSLIAGKLTICPIFSGWNFSSDIFKNSRATLNPKNSNELYEIFDSISKGTQEFYLAQTSESRIAFLKSYIFKTDDNSSKRIIDLSIKMIKNKN